jgi:hypothetical protein
MFFGVNFWNESMAYLKKLDEKTRWLMKKTELKNLMRFSLEVLSL